MNGTPSRERAHRVAAIEGLLFDLDGTLIDTVDLIVASARHATRVVLGQALPDDVLRHNIGVPLRTQMGEYAPGHVDELLVEYRRYNERVHDDLIREYPGTETALVTLHNEGYRLGIVTSKSRSVAQRGVEHFGLERFFEFIVAYEDTTIHKPQGEPVLEGARRFGVSIERCAYVGDSPHDMVAGRAAGALTVAATWGPFPERVLEPKPDYAIEKLGDLRLLLGGDEVRFRV
jgi:pyrophosphatase PpaX